MNAIRFSCGKSSFLPLIVCQLVALRFATQCLLRSNPVMANNRLQIAVKRVACCNIFGSGFPSGIKVRFENIVSEILSDYTLI